MSAHRLYLPLLLAAATGCHSFGPLVKRDSELNCPTDVRKAVPWCAGEDAIFHCPCGPDGPYYGHRPTCWRTWPAPATVWRDEYCNGGQCPSGMCISGGTVTVQDPQMIMLPTPAETPMPAPPATPNEPIIPAEDSPLPPIEGDAIPAPTTAPDPEVEQGSQVRPKLENPVRYTPVSAPAAAPAALERPVAGDADPVLVPLPPMTQVTPIVREHTAAIAESGAAPNCGATMNPTASAPRPTLPPRRPSGFARALAPRRDMPSARNPVVVPPVPVAATSFATHATPGQSASSRPTTTVAPAVVQRPATPAAKEPVVTTLSILPGATAAAPTTTSAPTTTGPVVRSTPIKAEPAAETPNQGRSGWIFVR
jgi:hypothetical protein